MEQLTLADEDIEMFPEPKSRISEHKKAQISNICQSRFGSEFLKDHGGSKHANFSTLLEMLRMNQFASVGEVKGEAVCFLDAQVRWFQNPLNGEMQQRTEMVLMAENLKQRFVNLVENESSGQATEYLIADQLFEIFPQLDHIELHRRVNHFLSQSGNNMKERDIDVALAVNEISQEIFDGSGTSRYVFTFYSELSHFKILLQA